MRLRNIPGAKDVIHTHPYVVQEPQQNKGRWNEIFENDHPVHIEVGMGKGRFIMELAARNPHINYVGIEMYDSVLVRALEKIDEKEKEGTAPENLRFMRMDARELPLVFDKEEVGKIYLNFSDPWPKERHAKRRLTSRQFLERYDVILAKEGSIEFKTDNMDLFDFSLEEINDTKWQLTACTRDLHKDEELSKGNVMTEYEEKFSSMGNPIYKLIAVR